MKNIHRSLQLLFLLLVIIKPGRAQDYNTYQTTDAVILQVNGDIRTENRIRKVITAFSNNSGQLNVRLCIPWQLINYVPSGNNLILSPGLSFNLKMNINLSQIQDYLTSTKLFTTKGSLTLNSTTRPVIVEYIPLPAGPDQDGDFNLSITIRFNADDFNLDTPHANSQFIIKIDNAPVNRI